MWWNSATSAGGGNLLGLELLSTKVLRAKTISSGRLSV
jgi:hypothetical protein